MNIIIWLNGLRSVLVIFSGALVALTRVPSFQSQFANAIFVATSLSVTETQVGTAAFRVWIGVLCLQLIVELLNFFFGYSSKKSLFEHMARTSNAFMRAMRDQLTKIHEQANLEFGDRISLFWYSSRSRTFEISGRFCSNVALNEIRRRTFSSYGFIKLVQSKGFYFLEKAPERTSFHKYLLSSIRLYGIGFLGVNALRFARDFYRLRMKVKSYYGSVIYDEKGRASNMMIIVELESSSALDTEKLEKAIAESALKELPGQLPHLSRSHLGGEEFK
jgi:hypothetical protein